MATDAEVRQSIQVAFGRAKKPVHFTNYTHCEECREHDDLLRARDVHSLKISDIDNPGWDPICYISPEGFAYYFPAFVRLTLENGKDSYLSQLLFHLTYQGKENKHLRNFSREQRSAVAAFLEHIADAHLDIIEHQLCNADLETARILWSARS